MSRSIKAMIALLFGLSFSAWESCSGQQGVELVASSKSITKPLLDLPLKPLTPAAPSKGTVLLCGGGALPRQIREVFHEHGKGSDGSLVLIPTASVTSDFGDYSAWLDYWASFQWRDVHVIHSRTREEAMQDETSRRILENATAVWMSGGDQSRLADRYAGTPIERGLMSVLARGGIVGGTSAGAAITSSIMISGGWNDPQLKQGFSILSKAIVDQHFTQKRRFERLAKAVQSNPNRLGIGVDESTGLFISENRVRVVGDGAVFLFRHATSVSSETPSMQENAFLSIQTAKLLPGDEIESSDLDVFGY